MRADASIRSLRLATPFVISRGARTHVENLFLTIDDGLGEGAPIYYHGQTAQSLLRAAADTGPLLEYDPDDIETIMAAARALRPDQSGWLCALDIALHDRLARRANLPLWKLLHDKAGPIPATSYTLSIGEPDVMLAQARAAEDFPALKVKCGGPCDLEALRLLAREDGRPLRVDANGGWDIETTHAMLGPLVDCNVELLEQPVPHDRVSQLKDLLDDSPIPIVLDESVQTGLDVHLVFRYCHGINIKLAKCGGILEALRMIELARHYERKVMIGCMLESSLAVTTAAHLGVLVDWLDLDAHLLLADDPFRGLSVTAGAITLPDAPGLGVTASP